MLLYTKKSTAALFIVLIKNQLSSFFTTLIAQSTGLWQSCSDHTLFLESEIMNKLVCQFLGNEFGFQHFWKKFSSFAIFSAPFFFSVAITEYRFWPSGVHTQNSMRHDIPVWNTIISDYRMVVIKICNPGYYGLKCVSLKMVCWYPNPKYFRVWPYWNTSS